MKYFICLFLFLSSLQGDEFEEGIELIKHKEYAQAAGHFKRAVLSGDNPSAALFGKVICEVALGKDNKAAKHLQQLTSSLSCKKCDQAVNPPMTAKGQVAAYECRLEVRKVSQELRILVEKMVADTIPGFMQKIRIFRYLNPYIDMLERSGFACCQTGQNARCCIEPLVEQLKLWNSEGLPIQPKQDK